MRDVLDACANGDADRVMTLSSLAEGERKAYFAITLPVPEAPPPLVNGRFTHLWYERLHARGGGVAATEIDLVALQQDRLGNTGRAEGVLGEVASLRILA